MIRKAVTAACILEVTLVGSVCAGGTGNDTAAAVDLELKAMPIMMTEESQSQAPEDAVAQPSLIAAPFGQAGSWRWNVHGGLGEELEDAENRFGLGGLSFSYFSAENFSIDFEFNGLYFDQEMTENAAGFNFNLLFRWHILARDDWSFFVDFGGGVMETSHAVPAGAGGFSFLAQGGGGISYEISDNVRMFTGVRLHHVSNARTFDFNPGLDSLYVYAGLSFPF